MGFYFKLSKTTVSSRHCIFVIILLTIVIVEIFILTNLKPLNRQSADTASLSHIELTQLGNAAFTDGKFDESLDLLLTSKKLAPNYVPNLVALGNLYRYRGHYDLSEEVYLEALALAPTSALYTDVGKLYRNWEKYDYAIDMFNKAIEIDPTNDSIYSYGLGYLYRDQGEYDKAEKSFAKAIELNPQNDFNYMGMGDLYRHMGQYNESETYLKKAIEMNPKSESYLGLGWLYIDMKRDADAKVAFQTYLDMIKPKAEVYLGLGFVEKNNGNYSVAKDYFEKAQDLNSAVGAENALSDLKNTHPEIFQ
jgi:tetratricopeptide (TPR) repeat protein